MMQDILYVTDHPNPALNGPQLPLTPSTNLFTAVTEYIDRHPMRGLCVLFAQPLTQDQLVELNSIIELCDIQVYACKVTK